MNKVHTFKRNKSNKEISKYVELILTWHLLHKHKFLRHPSGQNVAPALGSTGLKVDKVHSENLLLKKRIEA